MIQKKSLGNVIKRALQTGTFNYMGQESNQIPPQLFKLDQLPLDGQNWWECMPLTKMDFSNNQIRHIPEQIVMFIDLQVLRIKNNHLEAIPPCLHKFQNLKSLDAARNKLTTIPKQLSACRALVELILSQNSIQYLPDLSGIRTLEHLIISDNKIKLLPIFGQGLRKVEASANQIVQISASSFKLCNKLEVLTLNKNYIERIEKGSFSLTHNMIVLELKQNRLTRFTQAPWSQRLDILGLAFNRLTQFDDFDRCPNLTVLILNDNKLKKISSNIIKLKGLKTLDLSNNDLPDLPSEIGFINSIVRLQIEGNPLKAIRQNIRVSGTNNLKNYLKDRMDVKQRESLEKNLTPESDMSPHQLWTKLLQQFCMNGELVLRGIQLSLIHELVFERDIKVLNVNDNKISVIPEQIGNLQGLKALYVNQNFLERLPYSLSVLPNLDIIQAQNNKLTDFVPFQRPFFKSLNYLDLSTNKISQIPQSILKLPKLRTLMLSYNKLTDVDILWNQECLPCLEILDVSSNQLTNVSDSVFAKYSLNYLNFENNNLSRLPTVLGFMKLLGLKIDGNPLKLIKRQVIEKGTVAIMDHLRNKHTGDLPYRPPSPKVVPEKDLQEQRDEEEYQQGRRAPYQEERPFRQPQKEEIEAGKSRQQKQAEIQSIQKEIKVLEDQLQTGWNMNNYKRNEMKKKIQTLLIQRNKLLKK